MNKILTTLFTLLHLFFCYSLQSQTNPQVHPYYLLTSDYSFSQAEHDSIVATIQEVQAWYQVATGGLTFDLATPGSATTVNLPNSSTYYLAQNRWASIHTDMTALGYTPIENDHINIYFIKGGGGMALGQSYCNKACGVAMVGMDVFADFNTGMDWADCPDAPGGVGAWPCIPAATAAHEIGHAFGLKHPNNVPETVDVAKHSIMQTHWNYPYNWAPPADSPWGLLSLERQQLEASIFFYSDIDVLQPFEAAPVVNLPDLGGAPSTLFNYSISDKTLTFNNTSTGADLHYWTFGNNKTSNEINPVHVYDNYGVYTIRLRASAANNMMDMETVTITLTNNDPDCEGIPGGPALPGTACDDNDPNTIDDTYDINCDCIGTPIITTDLEITCPPGQFEYAPTGTNGLVLSWDSPTAATTCTLGGCPTDPIPGFTLLGTFNNSQYYLSTQSKNWTSAQLDAVANNGYLAVINDVAENQFISDAIGSSEAVFIGLSDAMTEGDYQWANGDPLSYTNWQSGQPSNDSPEVDYVALHGWSNGQWADYHFWTQKLYVMEVECNGLPGNINIVQTSGPPSGSFFPIGTAAITYEATDDCGNQATCSFSIVVDASDEEDCEGVPGGSALPGTACDDNDPNTVADTYDTDCNCIGTPVSGDLSIECPSDINMEIPTGEFGVTVNWDIPIATTTCTLGNDCPSNPIPGFTFLGAHNNSQYYLSQSSYNWENAQSEAVIHNGHLAVINNDLENQFLADAIGSGTSAYIGLSDAQTEGTYQWVNGDPVSYTNWELGQPDNPSPEVDYIVLHGWSNGQWADYHFWTQKAFIMEIACTGSGSNIEIAQTGGPSNGSFLPIGTHIITYEATDNCNNTATCSFSVIISSDTPCTIFENFALQQMASQSSTRFDAGADRAVDGNTSGNFWSDYSVSHTEWENQAWWEVDLSEIKDITEIKVWNRTDCCGHHLKDYYVFVSETPFVSTDLTETLNQAGVWSSYQDQIAETPSTIPVTQSGQYIRIQMANTAFLALAEVEVLGCASNSPNLLNLQAQLNGNMATDLIWISQSNKTIDRFFVEKSRDGHFFETMLEQEGDDISTDARAYRGVDANPMEGVNYYRVKLEFEDGLVMYSNMVNVLFKPEASFMVFPNPATNQVNVYLDRFLEKEIRLVIFDPFGRLIYQRHFPVLGDKIFQIDLTGIGITDGMYFITVYWNGKTFAKKLMVGRKE